MSFQHSLPLAKKKNPCLIRAVDWPRPHKREIIEAARALPLFLSQPALDPFSLPFQIPF